MCASESRIIAELTAVIERLQGENASLRAEVEGLREHIGGLEAKLGGGSSLGRVKPDFVKPKRSKPAGGKPRRQRAQGYARRREEPTRRVVHVVDRCRDCGCALVGGSVKRRRQVLHVPIVPVEVIEHEYVEGRCPLCGKRNVAKVELAGEVVGKSRLSVQTMALIASLREVGRLPVRAIRWLLASLHGLHLSVGEIVAVLQRVAGKGKGLMAQLRQQLLGSVSVHADETGWRENGENGYLWSFSDKRVRYFHYRASRSSAVVGESFTGVLVSDFYAAYNIYEGPHQRCWVHLLGDVHELKEHHPGDESVAVWAQEMHTIYRRAKAYAAANEQAPRAQRVAARQRFEEELLDLCRPYLGRECPQRKLCERVDHFLPELFLFVELPQVASDNNAAERALRPQVIARKISGGTRSPQGSQTKSTLATIFSTWMAQGLNPFTNCLQLLSNSP